MDVDPDFERLFEVMQTVSMAMNFLRVLMRVARRISSRPPPAPATPHP